MREALELNRRSGFPAYAGYLRAYDGWIARLAGDLNDTADGSAREAVEATSAVDHPWWHSFAAGLLAATLVETGDAAEAEAVARAGLAARRGTARPAAAAVRRRAGRPDRRARRRGPTRSALTWTARPAGPG